MNGYMIFDRRQGSSEEDPEVMMHEPGVRDPAKRIQKS